LELKEESEKATLPDVKEKRRYKRTDLFSVLAAIGVLAVLLFEAFFVFEVYRVDPETARPYLPPAVHQFLFPAIPESEPVEVPAPVEPVVEVVEPAVVPDVAPEPEDPVEIEAPKIPGEVPTDAVPDTSEEIIPVG
jgi:hypothetical protein